MPPAPGIVSNTKDNVPTVATKPSVPSPSRRDVTSVVKVPGPPELWIVRWSRDRSDDTRGGFDVFCGKKGAPGTYFVGRTRLAGASSLLDDGATLNVSPPRGVCSSTYDVWSIAMNDCGALCVGSTDSEPPAHLDSDLYASADVGADGTAVLDGTVAPSL